MNNISNQTQTTNDNSSHQRKSSLLKKFSEAFTVPRAYVKWLALVGVIGHPVYWYVWTHLIVQRYESLELRAFAAFVCLPLIAIDAFPRVWQRYGKVIWFISMTVALPFIFTFLVLMNEFSLVYVASLPIAALLSMMLFREVLAAFTSLIVGVLCGIFLFWLVSDTSLMSLDYTNLLKTSPLLLFIFTTGWIFNRLDKDSARLEERLVAQIETEKIRASAGSIAHESRNPISQARYILSQIVAILPTPKAHRDSYNLSSKELEELLALGTQGKLVAEQGLQVLDVLLNEVSGRGIHKDSFEYLTAGKITQRALLEFNYESQKDRDRVKFFLDQDFTFLVNPSVYVFILVNLIKNALYYFKEKPEAEIEITVNNHIVTVRDTGPGIPVEKLATLFTPFKTSGKVGGTGLGLAYCKRAMQAMDGEIVCRSQYGEFTEFVLSFPMVDPVKVEEDRVRKEAELKTLLSGKHILLVDDDPLLLRATDRIFENLGCYIDHASNGQEALTKLKSKAYQLILTDLNMPVMSGYELAQEIAEGQVPEALLTPMIFYTSEPRTVAQAKADKVHVTSVLEKPATSFELLDALHQALAQVQTTMQVRSAKDKLKGRYIVVADDSDLNREIVCRRLQGCGVHLLHANHGQAVLKWLDSAEVPRIDAILLDMFMPGLDGYEVMKAVRARPDGKAIPIIAISGDDKENVVQRGKPLGLTDCLGKPFEREALIKMLGTYMLELTPEEQSQQKEETVCVSKPETSTAGDLDEFLRQYDVLEHTRIKADLEHGMKEMIQAMMYGVGKRLVRLQKASVNQDLVMSKDALHRLLGLTGFLGAQALTMYIRTHVYPEMNEGKWPSEKHWLMHLEKLTQLTLSQLFANYNLTPQALSGVEEEE